MKKELEGRLNRLEKRAAGVGFTDEQWRKLEYLFREEPEPPELRDVKIPLEMLRELIDDQTGGDE